MFIESGIICMYVHILITLFLCLEGMICNFNFYSHTHTHTQSLIKILVFHFTIETFSARECEIQTYTYRHSDRSLRFCSDGICFDRFSQYLSLCFLCCRHRHWCGCLRPRSRLVNSKPFLSPPSFRLFRLFVQGKFSLRGLHSFSLYIIDLYVCVLQEKNRSYCILIFHSFSYINLSL